MFNVPRQAWQVRRSPGEREQIGTSAQLPARASRAQPQIEPGQPVGQRVLFPLGGDLRHIGLAGQQRAERLLHVLVQRIETARPRTASARSGAPPANSSSAGSIACPSLLAQPRDRLPRATAAQSSSSGSGCAPSAAAIEGREVIRISRLPRRRLLERLEHAVRRARRHLMRRLDDGDLVALPIAGLASAARWPRGPGRRRSAACPLPARPTAGPDASRLRSARSSRTRRSTAVDACDVSHSTAQREPRRERLACPSPPHPAAAARAAGAFAAHAVRSCASGVFMPRQQPRRGSWIGGLCHGRMNSRISHFGSGQSHCCDDCSRSAVASMTAKRSGSLRARSR